MSDLIFYAFAAVLMLVPYRILKWNAAEGGEARTRADRRSGAARLAYEHEQRDHSS